MIIIAILNYSVFYQRRMIFNRYGLQSQYAASEALQYLKLIKKLKLTSSYSFNLNDPWLFKFVHILISQKYGSAHRQKSVGHKAKVT